VGWSRNSDQAHENDRQAAPTQARTPGTARGFAFASRLSADQYFATAGPPKLNSQLARAIALGAASFGDLD
jgi:hypothetical protein